MSCLRNRRLPKATDVCFRVIFAALLFHMTLSERGSAVSWGLRFPTLVQATPPLIEKTVLSLGSSVLLTSQTRCPWRHWPVSLSPKPTALMTEVCEACCLVEEPRPRRLPVSLAVHDPRFHTRFRARPVRAHQESCRAFYRDCIG